MQGFNHPRHSRPIHLAALLALLLATFASLLVAPPTARAAAPFAAGNIVVYRVGSGTGSLVNTGSPVFLDEYTSNGALVQSIALPTSDSGANKQLIASGTATSEGFITRSTDGKYLIVTGYGATTGTSLSATTGTAVPRVVGRVDSTGSVDTSTALTDFASSNNPRSAVSANGTDLWVAGGAGGVRYATLGGTTSTQLSTTVANIRQVNIFSGQLYTSDSSGTAVRLGAVGSGLPTTAGQIITNLPGFATATGSPYAFFLADLDGVSGVDTLYVADDAAGLQKYSLVSGTWVSNGTVGAAADAYRGLTGGVSGTTVTLFATRKGGSGATGGGELVSIVDSSGYNGAFSATPTLLATATANTAFRGVAFAPVSAPVAPSITTQPQDQTISANVTASLSVVASGTAPLSYQWYQGVTGDTSTPVGADSATFVTPPLTSTTSYWVRVSNSAGSVDSNTATVTVNAVAVAPSITTQPQDQTISANVTASLSVVASGTAPLSYQWYQGVTGDTSTPVGANSATFVTPPLSSTTSYWVRVSNSADFVDSTTAIVTVLAACSIADTPIGTVQGSTDITPLSGQTVTVQGVVVGDYELPGGANQIRGFYLQDAGDGIPATSDGIFVFTNSVNRVDLGRVVQVTGPVSEFQGQTQLSGTLTIEDCGSSGSVTPVDVSLPLPSADYLERYEGMLVRFPQNLYVTEHFQLGRFGQVVLSSGARLPQPTNIVAPGAPAQAQQAANSLNRIILDDDNNLQNPDPISYGRGGQPLSASNTLRGGDSATGITGVLVYGWAGNGASPNAYRVRALGDLDPAVPNFVAANPRPAGPPAVGGSLKVASFNVLNYFLTLDIGTQANCGPLGSKQECRGAQTAEELTRQQQKLNAALVKLDGDVVGMMELENTQDAQGNDVNPPADIVGRLNASLGSDVYGYIDTGVIGTDTIRVGLIYKKASVTPVGSPLIDGDPIHNRPPVAQLFQQNSTGQRFTVVVNHFKSKSSCPTSGADNDQGDGQGCWNATRVAQAQRLVSWLKGTVVPTTGDSDLLLIGDFNSYAKEDPITVLANAGFTNLVSTFSGADAYSYVFDGQWGYLDQGLASPSLLAQVTGAGDYHINSDEPSVLDYNTDFKSAGQIASLFNADEFRTSDHDPVVIGLGLKTLAQANADSYTAEAGAALSVSAAQGVLANDVGSPLSIIGSTKPTNGTLSLAADGSFSYTPNPGYTGSDSFTYTVGNTVIANAVQSYRTNIAPLGTFGGVNVGNDGYGSSLYPVPGSTDEFYGLTDRGPNVDGPGGTKVEPKPDFTPAIGKFKFVNGQAVLEQIIPLQAADGTPFNGQVNGNASTGETITDLNGSPLPTSPNGYDSEGLVALADGTFWVSDEYGPLITHFDATGKQIEQISPFAPNDQGHQLPQVLAKRRVNRGMEGLTITPDGSTLVGIMQSPLINDITSSDTGKTTSLRIVTYNLTTGATKQYLYLLDNPATTGTSVSEITAISNTTFLVDERDGNFLPSAYKKLFRIDISGATDVGAAFGANTLDPVKGLLIGGTTTIEALVKNQTTSAATVTLAGAGITPVAKSLYLDLGALLTTLDAQGRFFPHDKIEGVAVLNGGAQVVISNDSDFGIDGLSNSTPPFQLHAKITPAGVQDFGEYLVIDLTASTATVTINTQDTIAPDTTIDTTPTNPSGSSSASFTFHGTDSGAGVASFECSLDGADFAACTSGVSYSNLADGSHTFAVRAVDGGHNTDATPASYTWLVDTTAPVVSITAQPANPINSGDASFSFSSTATDVASYECKLDGAAFAGCSSPVNFTGLGLGAHTFQVRATDNAGNTGAAASYTWTINAAATTTSFTTTANPAVTGQELIFKATVGVVAPGVGTPNGTVTFKNGGAPIPGCSAVALSAGVAQCNTSFATAGNYVISVSYSGSTYFLASASAPGVQSVKVGSTTTVSSSLNPSFFGQSVTFTASVSTATGVKPTGSVTILDGTTVLATRNLSNGVVSYSTTALSPGSHTITVVYNGSATIGGSVSSSLSQVVNQAVTSTALVASLNPSVIGQAVKLTATVTTVSGVGTATGTVTFYEGTTVVGSVALSGGKANLTVRLPVGSHSITAVYGGSTNFAGSSSANLDLAVNKAATTTALTLSPATWTFGKNATLTATVKAVSPGVGTPAGTVTFYDNDTLLVTVSLTNGKATFSTATLTRGSHSIRAVFSGNGDYSSSEVTLTKTVN